MADLWAGALVWLLIGAGGAAWYRKAIGCPVPEPIYLCLLLLGPVGLLGAVLLSLWEIPLPGLSKPVSYPPTPSTLLESFILQHQAKELTEMWMADPALSAEQWKDRWQRVLRASELMRGLQMVTDGRSTISKSAAREDIRPLVGADDVTWSVGSDHT